MSLAVTTTLIEMFWHTTTFQKECHTVCLTVDTISRNQHTLTLNQNHIDVQQLMSSHLIQCDSLLYKQNIHTEQHKNDYCLREVSVLSELLLINKENWINVNSHKSKDNNICIVKNENPVSCQLWDAYLYNTYIVVVVVVVVAAELVVQESVLTYSIKKDFTYKSYEWRSWRRKKKRSCMWGEEVYNSLHWQISSSELLKKTTQEMKKNFHLWTLLIQSRQSCVNKHWQLYNNLFKDLEHNLEEKERDDVMSWTHTKVLWSSCLLRL